MSQQVVTELVIDSDTSGADAFSQKMGQAEGAARRGVDATNDYAKTIAGVSAGALAAVAGIKAFIDQVVDANKQLADMQNIAKQVGLSLADFQGVQFGGAIAGLSDAQINSGLQRSAQLLNDAQRNANSLSKEFEANNLSIKNANGQLISQNQLLGVAADLIRRAQSPQDQIAIAQMLGFTKEWVPLLEQGTDAMSALTAEARKAGAVIDDETIKRATEFDTQWRKSSVEFSANMKAALLGLLPYVDDLIDRLSTFIKSIDRAKIEAAADKGLQPLRDAGIPDAGGIKIGITPETSQAMDDFRKAPFFSLEFWAAAGRALASSIQTIGPQDVKWHSGTDPVMDTSDSSIQSAKNAAAWTAEGASFTKFAAEVTAGADIAAEGYSKVASRAKEANDQFDRAITTSKRHTDQLYADADAVGLGAGALAKYRTEAQLTSAAEAAGLELTPKRIAQIKDLGDDAADAANDLAKLKVASQIDFTRKTAFLSPEDVQIANSLKEIYGNDVPRALASSEAAAMRVNNGLKTIKDSAEQFASGFVKDLIAGMPAVQALENALKKLASSLIDSAVKGLVDQALSGIASSVAGAATGAISGASAAATSATILTTAGTTLAASMIAGATEAAAILGLTVPVAAATLPVAGAVTGTEVAAGGVAAGAALAAGGATAGAAIWGPIGLLVAAIAAIGAASFLGGGDDDELKKNKDAWAKMTDQVTAFNDAAAGFNLGPLTQAIQSLSNTLETLRQAADKAEDSAGAAKLNDTYIKGVTRVVDEFKSQADTLSPLATSIKAVNDEYKGLYDTLTSEHYYSLTVGLYEAAAAQIRNLIAQATADMQGDLTQRLNAANGKDYLNDASDVLKKHQDDLAKAAELGNDPSVLSQISAVFAAEAQKIVTDAALAGSSFSDFIQMFPEFTGLVTQSTAALDAASEGLSTLTERLNSATGKGYLNDASGLLKQHATDLSNAAVLGNDPATLAQISAVFSAEAQKVVEDAGLVGDSFNDFIKQFPELSGVVNQSTTALDAANDKFKALTDTINSYLDSLKLGSNSILSPQDQLASAQDQFNRQLGLAQGGDQNALGSITQYASALLDQAKSFYASSSGYTDIYRAVTSQLGGLTGGGPATGFSDPSVSSPLAMSGLSSSIMPQVAAPRAASNDNGQLFQQQTNTLVATIGGAAQAQIQALSDQVDRLVAQNTILIAAIAGNKPKALRPLQKTGTGG